MSTNIIYIVNPKDGTETFTDIEIRRDTDDYATAFATPDIDLTNRTQYGPGFTKVTDVTGTPTTKYKARFHSSTVGYSDYSVEMQAGNSSIIYLVRTQLKDPNSEVFTDQELQEAEQRAVDRLFPGILLEVKDTEQTTEQQVTDYDLPVGCFRVLSVFTGTTAENNRTEIDDYEQIENGTVLRLDTSDVSTGGLQLEINYTRAYRNSGEVPEIFFEMLAYDMLAEMFEILANERGVKFKAFAAQQRDSDIRPETLNELANKFRTLAEARRRDIERG